MRSWTDDTIALVISLTDNESRAAHVRELRRRLPVVSRIVGAVDGRRLDAAAVETHLRRQIYSPRYPFRLTSAEIGCFLSHRLAWQAALDSGASHALVFEDDAILVEDFEATIDRLFQRRGEWTFVQLHSHRQAECDGPFLARRPVPQVEMVGQLMTRQAAGALLAMSERFDRPVDSFIQLQWATGVPIHHVTPPVVMNGGEALGGSTISRRLPIMEKARRIVVRPIYKAILRARAYEALG